MDKIKMLYSEYYDKVMIWYGGLTFMEQMGVLFAVFVVGFGIVAFVLIKRASGS